MAKLKKGDKMQTDDLELNNFEQMACNFETASSDNASWLENVFEKWLPNNGIMFLASCIGASLVIHTLRGGGFKIDSKGLSLTWPSASL